MNTIIFEYKYTAILIFKMSQIEKEIMNEWSTKWFQFILDNPDIPWDWYELSKNPSITWDIVQQNPDKKWDWSKLSSNTNITWDIVQQNQDKPWDWKKLSSNTMENARKQFISEKLNAKSNNVSSQHI